MTGWRAVPDKQRRAFRRRNHVARDLYTPQYGPRIKESKKNHLIDEVTERELQVCLQTLADEEDLQRLDDDYDAYHFHKDLGLTSKE